MPLDPSSFCEDSRKLRHDFLNDLNSLKMNLQALQIVREDPEEFEELINLMLKSIRLYEQRIDATLKLIPDASGPAHEAEPQVSPK